MTDIQVNLTGSRRLTRNVLLNLLGTGAPLLVALVAIPLLIDGLGKDRFGVLLLAWMVVGYFSLFDLGLGRALTKLVAEKLGKGYGCESAELIWTAMTLMAVLGVVGVGVVAVISPWLVRDVLNISPALQHETLLSFYLLAAAIPIVITATGLRGVLEAHQRFGLVNIVRVPLGIFTFLGPVLVLPISNNLAVVVAVLVFARLLAWFAYVVLCFKVEPGLRGSAAVHGELIKPLLSFGGWMTVSNIISPLMVYMDRFFIGAMLTMVAVTYYATPYEIVTRLLVIPGALMGVMFPAFAAALVQDRAHALHLFERSVSYIFLALYPVILVIVIFSREGLTMWLGAEFAGDSSLVLQLLAIGVLVNSLAHVPLGLVQGAGRPDLTAKLHLVELPFYLLLLWWLLATYGIVGVAIAWLIRVSVDALLLFILAGRFSSTSTPLRPVLVMAIAMSLLLPAALISGFVTKLGFFIIVLSAFSAAAWFVVFGAGERDVIKGFINVKR